jgi:hypothetical protein
MLLSHQSILLAGSIFLFSITSSLGEQICRPDLSFTDVRLSDPDNLQRKWTAVVDVDASRCATTSGRFGILFVRLKENGPDLPFWERFIWKQGRMELSLELATDEVVFDYSLGSVAACTCRGW